MGVVARDYQLQIADSPRFFVCVMIKRAMKKSSIHIVLILAACILYIMAIYIYLSNRDEEMLLYSWLGINVNGGCLEYVRIHSIQLPAWAKYNLPDGLWMLSYLLFIEGIWCVDNRIKMLFCAPVTVFACVMELLQYEKIIPGTGDMIDILAYIIAISLYLLTTKLKQMYYGKDN